MADKIWLIVNNNGDGDVTVKVYDDEDGAKERWEDYDVEYNNNDGLSFQEFDLSKPSEDGEVGTVYNYVSRF